jgi:hypothetical protein
LGLRDFVEHAEPSFDVRISPERESDRGSESGSLAPLRRLVNLYHPAARHAGPRHGKAIAVRAGESFTTRSTPLTFPAAVRRNR